MPLYGKPVRVLLREMIEEMKLAPDQIFGRDDVLDWFKSHYPLVKEGTIHAHLSRFSTNNKNRLHYSARGDGSEDILFQVDGSRFRLYDPKGDPPPIHEGSAPATGMHVEPEVEPGGSEFAYEHDLRDYLAKNLHLLEPGLKLYTEEAISGVEFPAGGRFIDILAVDAMGGYVVVELKVSKGYDRAVGQLLRYMGWIEKHQADPGQGVRGVIVAKAISDDLRLACKQLPSVRLFGYTLAVSLQPIEP